MQHKQEDDGNLRELTKDSTLVLDGHFLKVKRDTVILPDGKETTREYILHPGAVVIIPLMNDGRVLVERQFRYPLNKVFIEFPAGKLEYGEDLLTCAKRELEEETGCAAQNWVHLTTIHNAIAYANERIEIFLAREITEGQRHLDDGEFLETFYATPEELSQWVREGKITDVKTIIGIFWLEKILRGEWPA